MLIKDLKEIKLSDKVSSELFYRQSSEGSIVKDVEGLSYIIDEPCLKACEYLYNCNIKTLTSSANVKDVNEYGYIGIDYESLSEENKKVCKDLYDMQLIDDDPENLKYNRDHDLVLYLKIPITEKTTIEEFSSKMMSIASMFCEQDLLFAKIDMENISNGLVKEIETGGYFVSIIEEEIEKGTITLKDDSLVLEDAIPLYIEYMGYYYSKDEDCCWLNEDLYNKHLEYMRKNNKNK